MKQPFAEYIRYNIKAPFLLITCGLPATLKTTVGREVARITGALLLRSDDIRREVLQSEDIFDAKVAGDMQKRTQVYYVMFAKADEIFRDKKSIILDATFVTQAMRRRAAEIAAKQGARFYILQTDCPRETSLRWMKKRTKEHYESNALTEEAYLNNLKSFEAVDVEDIKKLFPGLDINHFVVDTSQTMPEKWYVISEVKK